MPTLRSRSRLWADIARRTTTASRSVAVAGRRALPERGAPPAVRTSLGARQVQLRVRRWSRAASAAPSARFRVRGATSRALGHPLPRRRQLLRGGLPPPESGGSDGLRDPAPRTRGKATAAALGATTSLSRTSRRPSTSSSTSRARRTSARSAFGRSSPTTWRYSPRAGVCSPHHRRTSPSRHWQSSA